MLRRVARRCLPLTQPGLQYPPYRPSLLSWEIPRDGRVELAPGDEIPPAGLLCNSPSASVHSSLGGKIESVANGRVTLRTDATWTRPSSGAPTQSLADYPAFLAGIGLVGMGGARFPAAVKVKASQGVHTLVINGCECEPCVTIDRTLLQEKAALVRAGAEASAHAVGAKQIILATHSDNSLITNLRELYPGIQVKGCGGAYPSGAEKLILGRLLGNAFFQRMPPAGVLPFQLGYLIQNVASLHAIGRAVKDGVPVVERPLTLTVERMNLHLDLVAPIGMTIGELLAHHGCTPTPEDVILSGGLMMGVEADVATPVHKGTTSIFVLPRSGLRGPERPCIRCGACYNACPLGLHPVALTERLPDQRWSPATRAQMNECFLCGCCDAVCPSQIPLAERLRQGKQKLRSMGP